MENTHLDPLILSYNKQYLSLDYYEMTLQIFVRFLLGMLTKLSPSLSFLRLHDSCSTTQQTNSLLEQRLQSMVHRWYFSVTYKFQHVSSITPYFFWQTQKMEIERERLNQRIYALTEKLADAKFTDSVESFNVRSFNS